MKNMEAFILTGNGGPEKLVQATVPRPVIGDDEVLVEVGAISINPVDVYVRKNPDGFKRFIGGDIEKDRKIIGWDISGIITETGKSVTRFRAGDEVFGMLRFPANGNAYAQYVAAPESDIALKPAGISHVEAAAATLAALTAWQALFVHGNLKKGQRALIHGASGGVGPFAVQMAKTAGAYVIGSSSAANRDFVLSLGADEHIDYTTDYEKMVAPVDFALDSSNLENLRRTATLIMPGGHLISISPNPDEAFLALVKERKIQFDRMLVVTSGEQMTRIAEALNNGTLRAPVFKTFPFGQLPEAHRAVESGKPVGKVVVEVR